MRRLVSGSLTATNVHGCWWAPEGAVEALRDSEARFRDLSESSLQGVNVVTFDPEVRPLYANPAFLAIFGFDSLDEYLAQPSDETVIAPSELERLRTNLARGLGEHILVIDHGNTPTPGQEPPVGIPTA